MRIPVGRWAIGGLLALAAGAVSLADAGAAAVARPEHVPNCCENSSLRGVAVIGRNDVWAVGGGSDQTSDSGALLHWDGQVWRFFPGAHVPGDDVEGLGAISAVYASDIWAVGFTSPSWVTPVVPIAYHWDGRFWSAVAVPPVGVNEGLGSVAAISATDAWAVGGPRYSNAGTLYHWDGSAWSQVASPLPDVQSVSATSSSNVWAIGTADSAHFDGTGWVSVPLPTLRRGTVALSGIAALPGGGAWAVGTHVVAGQNRSYILSFEDGRWQRVRSPNPRSEQSSLSAVSADSPTDAWAVGRRLGPGYHGELVSWPYILHWNGATWKWTPSPLQGPGGDDPAAIGALGPGDAWVVAGSDFIGAEESTALGWNGKHWHPA
jgi:hypothetical protein